MNVHRKSKGDDAVSSHVSDYGLVADAYSVGVTIKVLLSDDLPTRTKRIHHRHDIPLFTCKMNAGQRYKFLDATPKHARELVDKLTVPLARDQPWIKGGVSADNQLLHCR